MKSGKTFIVRAFSAAMLAAALGGAAQAQQTTCSPSLAMATPVNIRAEGTNEQVADLTLSCTGDAVTGTLFVTLSLPVTSATVSGASEALAVIGGTAVQGMVSGSTIKFINVQIPSGSTTITITNVRVNASAALNPTVTESALLSYGCDGGACNASAASSITVATALPGLTPGTGGAASYSACADLTPASGPAFYLRFGENFPTAFKVRGDSGNNTLGSEFPANTETGYYLSVNGADNLATSGTRIRILFSGVPSGVNVYVPAVMQSGTTILTLTASETMPFSAVAVTVPAVGAAQVAITSGAGEAVYEVTQQNPNTLDSFTVPVYLNGTSNSLAGSSITATAGLAAVNVLGNIPNFSNATGTLTVTASAIASCLPLAVTPTTLSTAEQGIPYLQALAAAGVQSWNITTGNLPAGLSLDATTGLISGTPTVNGSFPFTITMTGPGTNNTATQSFTLQVNPAPSISTGSLPTGQEGMLYSQTLAASGGIGAYNWYVTSGSLPPGVALDFATGIIHGNPGATGSSSFTVKVSDSTGATASASLSIQINTPPTLCTTPSSMNPSMRSEGVTELLGALTFTCQGTGGTGTFQVSLNGGATLLQIDSKILNPATNLTEAALIVNGVSMLGTLDQTETVMTFSNVTIPAGTVNVTIANLRTNTSLVTSPQITEAISATGFGVAMSPGLVGFVLPSLGQSVPGVANYATCAPLTASSPAFTVTVKELVSGAFKTQGDSTNTDPQNLPNTETGYYVSSGSVNNQANSGTRVRVVFNNVLANVNIYVPTTITVGGAILTLSASEAGAFSAVSAVTPTVQNTLPQSPALGQVTITNSGGEAIYEVTTAQTTPGVLNFPVPVYLVATGAVTATVNPITATVSYAPVGATSNIPDFVSTLTPLNAATFSLCPPPLSISTTTLPNGVQNSSYSTTLATNGGGDPPFTWSITAGTLPMGLNLNTATGAISGMPTVTGQFPITVQVADSFNPSDTATQQLNLVVASPLIFSNQTIGLVRNSPFSLTLASGGTPPYNCGYTAPPPLGDTQIAGITVNPSTCVLSGTPTVSGPYNFSLTAADSSSPPQTVQQQYSLTVANPLQIVATALPTISSGATSYSATLVAAGGISPYNNWTVSSGSLPNGFALNASTGVITGNPSAIVGGPFMFSVTVQDNAGNTSPARSYSTVPLIATTTSISGPGAQSPLGASVTLTAQVSPNVSTGKVTFYDGVAVLGTSALNNGTAALSTSLLTSGSHSLKAYYLGDSGHAASGSTAASLTVTVISQGGFKPPVNLFLGTTPSAVVTADFNNDGIPDLAVTTSSGVTVFLGRAGGTFQQIAVIPGLTSVAVGDFDGDGKADLFGCVTAFSTISFSRGNGDGTFQPPVTYAVNRSPGSAAIADFNRDGIPDAAPTPDGSASLIFGESDGTFYPGNSYVDGAANGIAIADFNQDGVADIVASFSNGVTVFLGNGDGTLQPGVSYPGPFSPLAIADFNGDGIPDVATSTGVLPGKGDGTLGALIPYPASATNGNANTVYPAVGDINGDGKPDLVLTNYSLSATTVNTLLGNGNGTFANPVPATVGTGPNSAVLADFNGDGLIDMAVTNGGSQNVSILLGTSDLTMSCVASDGPSSTSAIYANICRVFGGNSPYTFSISAGALPAGLTLNPMTGGFFGTPTVPGAYQFTVEASDSSDPTQTATQTFSGNITGSSGTGGGGTSALMMTCVVSDGPSSTSTTYANICRVFGGTSPYTWSISAGALPAGVTLNPATGGLFGAPTVPGAYQFTVEAADSSDPIQTATQAFSGSIAGSAGKLTASPESVILNATPGTPATKTVTLTYSSSLAGAPNFTTVIQSSAPAGINWLSVSPSSGAMTAIAGNTSPYLSTATLTITADPSLFIPGTTVTGTITYIANGVSSDMTTVAMNVSNAAQLTASPQSLTFNYTQGGTIPPAAQRISVFSVPAGATFTASASSNWLSASTDGNATTPGSVDVFVNVNNLQPGTFTGSVTITGGANSISVPVTLTVVKPNALSLAVSPTLVSLSATRGNNTVSGQVTVSSTGGGTLNFAAQASVSGSDPSWLTLVNTGGSATSSTPAALSFTANPTGLHPGIYTGRITVNDTGSSNQVTVTVVLTVTPSGQTIQLSESGLSFSAVAEGAQPPGQSFTIANSGSGTLNWTTQINTLSGGSWLQLSTTGGASFGGQLGIPVTVSVDTVGLAAGQYYGSVNITSLNATNSVQTISVVLTVLPAQTTPGETISTGGVILTGAAGSTIPAQQTVNVFNPSSAAVTYTASLSTADGTGWLSVTPSSGSLSPGTNGISVAADLSGLAAGLYTGSVSLAFSDGSSAMIQVLTLATGETGNAVVGKALRPRDLTACTGGSPGFLIPIFQQPVGQATPSVAAPQTVQVEVIDSCGNPVTAGNAGTVQVTFSSAGSGAGAANDSGISLQDIGGGIWEATWVPVNAGQVTLQVEATEAGITLNPALNVGNSVTVTVQGATATSPPQPTGVSNAASAAQAIAGVVAPGSYVAIYGTGLAGNDNPSAASLPLPMTLNGTQLWLGGLPMPLLYAGPGQVNALIPQGLAPNATYPLVVVSNGGTVQSVPMALTVTELQPGVYTADYSGSGAGIVTNALTALLISAANPAHANDYLTIYCTGLGAVIGANGEQQPADGAAPTNVLYSLVKNVTVTATIGGVSAPVSFAGLTPTLAALYQINAQVPPGVTPGDAVPVVITTVDSQTGVTATSNPVTIVVQ